MLNAFTLGVDLSKRAENSKKIGNLNLLLSGIESINFYGFGNETQPPANDSAADVDRLRAAGFDDRGVHDICSITAYFAYVNRIADGLGVDLEEERA